MALMYISHDLAVVGQMADEIMVMYMGMVMEHASTDDIFDDPLHPYTVALWRSIPKIEGKLEQAAVDSAARLPSPYALIPGCPFFSRCERSMGGVCDAALPAPDRGETRAQGALLPVRLIDSAVTKSSKT